jgi:alpha-beta hydrolase superfamily lysophospholipase
LGEIGAAVELIRLVARLPWLSRLSRGSGEPVMVLPGFGAGDGSTFILRTFLQRLGYRVRGWGLGVNSGDVPQLMQAVARAVAECARAEGAALRLVGWSLGGYLVREAARDVPQHVDRVVTLGTPVIGGPKYTATAPLYRAAGMDFDAIDAAIEERERNPIQVPITAIYSESDGIVDWRACIDHSSPFVEHVQVRTSHVGLGFAPEVLRIVAISLARKHQDDP